MAQLAAVLRTGTWTKLFDENNKKTDETVADFKYGVDRAPITANTSAPEREGCSLRSPVKQKSEYLQDPYRSLESLHTTEELAKNAAIPIWKVRMTLSILPVIELMN